ncbi:MAG: GNAT family N-acetyltransferase [Chlorobi bacterium]|nr:GNAT family N-acetyltransferase [Chlorobiota bacterium]
MQKIVLHARKTAVSFYLKLNYKIISEQFYEVGIPHFKMRKML